MHQSLFYDSSMKREANEQCKSIYSEQLNVQDVFGSFHGSKK